ncbi:MAG: ChaN family lipoprotein [Bacteriovoracaceae bacterium]|nr:ChaN family lipoprotein [Bacteriovoracaceae bacterium]
MKKQLNDLRRNIYRNLKQKAYSLEGLVSDELMAYRKDQVSFSKRPFHSSDIEQLKQSVLSSNVVYLGDFHTFDQNIRNVLRVLKVAANENKKCLIALEMVDAKYQYCVDAYMEGHLTELEFLESVHYHDSWRFPWTHYKLIFELAKEHKAQIMAINTVGDLTTRDEFAANILAQTLESSPDTHILVVYGELHISPTKIPARVLKKRPGTVQTIVHQNLDEVYWTLKEENSNETIVAFNDREFCINSAPPWVKYESMIYWYENLDSDPDFDIHEYIIEKGKKIFSDDTQENFLAISMEMISAVNVDLTEEVLENFNLHDHTGLEFIEEKIENLKDNTLIEFFQELIADGQSFRLPQDTVFYCSSYSMNRISYLAGVHILHSYLSVHDKSPTQEVLNKNPQALLSLFILESMYAFFFSKIMNPHRKCEMYWNLKHNAPGSINKHEHKLALDILDGEPLEEIVSGQPVIDLHKAGQSAGHIFGEYLYLRMFHMEDHTISLQDDFLSKGVGAEGFRQIRQTLLKELDYQSHKKRYF